MHSLSAALLEGRRADGSEESMVHAAQADPAAFGPLYERYRDRVYAYLRTRTLSDDDAADLTQHVFVHALDALPRYRTHGAPFAAWLLRIAHNVAINDRKRRRESIAWDLLPEALHPSQNDGPEAQVLQREVNSRLREALAACDPSAREVLALHYAAGLTVRETAAVVGRSEAAVKKQLTRTIRDLKEHYHDPTQ
jgi:RNA polymerase sigma-70 factor (ECF subfamily)